MELIDLTGRYNISRWPLYKDRVDGGAWHHTVTPTTSAALSQLLAVNGVQEADL